MRESQRKIFLYKWGWWVRAQKNAVVESSSQRECLNVVYLLSTTWRLCCFQREQASNVASVWTHIRLPSLMFHFVCRQAIGDRAPSDPTPDDGYQFRE